LPNVPVCRLPRFAIGIPLPKGIKVEKEGVNPPLAIYAVFTGNIKIGRPEPLPKSPLKRVAPLSKRIRLAIHPHPLGATSRPAHLCFSHQTVTIREIEGVKKRNWPDLVTEETPKKSIIPC
jgi:hypothetical protein